MSYCVVGTVSPFTNLPSSKNNPNRTTLGKFLASACNPQLCPHLPKTKQPHLSHKTLLFLCVKSTPSPSNPPFNPTALLWLSILNSLKKIRVNFTLFFWDLINGFSFLIRFQHSDWYLTLYSASFCCIVQGNKVS